MQKALTKADKVFAEWAEQNQRKAHIKKYDESETVKELDVIKNAFIKQFREVCQEYDEVINEHIYRSETQTMTEECIATKNYIQGKRDALLELQTKIMNGDY